VCTSSVQSTFYILHTLHMNCALKKVVLNGIVLLFYGQTTKFSCKYTSKEHFIKQKKRVPMRSLSHKHLYEGDEPEQYAHSMWCRLPQLDHTQSYKKFHTRVRDWEEFLCKILRPKKPQILIVRKRKLFFHVLNYIYSDTETTLVFCYNCWLGLDLV